jgi:hypothetical protein
VTVLADLRDFVACHQPHGTFSGDASEPTPNGYMVDVTCRCGVVFMRWVTPEEAALYFAEEGAGRTWLLLM